MSFTNVSRAQVWCNQALQRIVIVIVWLGIAGTSFAGHENDTGVKSFLFDIPAESLRDALFAYTGTTGLSVLVDDEVTSNERSAQVKGRFTAEDALKILLTDTGLDFQYTAANSFTLIPALARPIPRDDSHDQSYFRVVQTAVKHALCSHGLTLPGQYRAVIQLWIDDSGIIVRSDLLGSTGSIDRDHMLSQMLDGLPVGKRPADLPEPITLVVLPRPPDVARDCDSAAGKASAKARD